jgi:hypothetical protein
LGHPSFEALVRVHRAGEGAPYTGLEPAGTAVEPGIAAADAALKAGSVEPVGQLVSGVIDQGVRERHARAAARAHAAESVEQGPGIRRGVRRVRSLYAGLLAAGSSPHAHLRSTVHRAGPEVRRIHASSEASRIVLLAG